MPRPARRAQAPSHDAMTTPTRIAATNAITASIPPFMLETPPHAPFVTTPLPPSINVGHSITTDNNNLRGRVARAVQASQQTPTANGDTEGQSQDQSQISNHALESTASQPAEGEEMFDLAQEIADDARQLTGLRDISTLATWTLSSAKPGCGLPQLRHPSPTNFWQSDGPQPHTLTLHFFKLVAIVRIRIYLDFELDESYTPTKMTFFAGMSEGGLVEFADWQVQETIDPDTGEPHNDMTNIRGWIDIPLKGVGGRENVQYYEVASPARSTASRSKPAVTARLTNSNKSRRSFKRSDIDVEMEDIPGEARDLNFEGGDVLKAMVVQVRICENHQNGKDTHVRGFQVFARDEAGGKTMRKTVKPKKGKEPAAQDDADGVDEIVGLQPADWMCDPEIR